MMANSSANGSNGGATSQSRDASEAPLSSPKGSMRSVSFSSEVSVFTESPADDNTTIASTRELADTDEDMSPTSLFSGRWIEDIEESTESKSLAVVEVKDHSPVSKFSSDSKRKEVDTGTNNSRSSPNKIAGVRKRLFMRHESPVNSNDDNSIPSLSKEDDRIPHLSPKMTNGNSCSDLSIDASPSREALRVVSPLSQNYDLVLLNSGAMGQDDEQSKLLGAGYVHGCTCLTPNAPSSDVNLSARAEMVTKVQSADEAKCGHE